MKPKQIYVRLFATKAAWKQTVFIFTDIIASSEIIDILKYGAKHFKFLPVKHLIHTKIAEILAKIVYLKKL